MLAGQTSPARLTISPAEMDGDQPLMLYWIDPVDAADRLAGRSDLAGATDHFFLQKWMETTPHVVLD